MDLGQKRRIIFNLTTHSFKELKQRNSFKQFVQYRRCAVVINRDIEAAVTPDDRQAWKTSDTQATRQGSIMFEGLVAFYATQGFPKRYSIQSD